MTDLTSKWTGIASAIVGGIALLLLLARAMKLSQGKVSLQVLDLSAGTFVVLFVCVTAARFWALT